MKLRLTLTFIFLALWVRPCSYEYDDAMLYYNIFEQTAISDKILFPFLRDTRMFFDAGEKKVSNPYLGNLMLWKELLPKWSLEDLDLVLNNSDDAQFEKIWKKNSGKKDIEAKEYMQFARMSSDTMSFKYRRSWNYDDILQNKEIDINPILTEGYSKFEKVKNEQLRLRYAYQIIRALHYTKRYADAIDFFESRVLDQFEKTEIYYYTVDQVAGCYYSNGDYQKAAYLFFTVFDKSIDRKHSAVLSYGFCSHHMSGMDESKITDEDRIGWLTLQAWQGRSNVSALKKAVAIDPADSRVELLFMRALNDVEREVWPRYQGIFDDGLPDFTDNAKNAIQVLSSVADSIIRHTDIRNKDFWLLGGSYLDFLNGDVKTASFKINQVKPEKFTEQKQKLIHLYEVFKWKAIGEEQAKYIEQNFQSIFELKNYEWWENTGPAWQFLILDQLSHLYYKSGQLAESFLCRNELNRLENISSHKLIDALIAFAEKENKTTLEKLLMGRSGLSPQEALSYVYEVKGLYYLQEANAKEGHNWLKKSKKHAVKTESNISARIFSNNTIECFECDEEKVMVDSVFLADAFSFIKPKFDKLELAENLLRLDSITQSATAWKARLANYLLANYYFNVSNTGYFRGTLTNDVNCCHGFYLERNAKNTFANSVDDRITKSLGYNLYGVSQYPVTYYGLAKKSYAHYEKVIETSTNAELNARCLYMMAKCELNTYYNDLAYENRNDWHGVSYDGGTISSHYRKSFKKLKSEYSNTNFYSEALKECSFFSYYVSN